MISLDDVYYIFYEKGDDIYAYTDSKKLYKKFKKQRNMDLFTVVRLERTKESTHELAENFQQQILSEYSIKTKNENGDVVLIRIVLSASEHLTINNYGFELLNNSILKFVWISPMLFKHSIFKALKELEYLSLYLSQSMTTRNVEYLSVLYDNIKHNLYPDELSIFLELFGYTMKGE